MIAFSPSDIREPLLPKHRDAMLDLILVWGSLDGALGMFLGRIMGISMYDAAEKIGKLSGSAKLAKAISIIPNTKEGATARRFLKKRKKHYERFTVSRNRIAHSRCAGYHCVDDDYIIFAVFERHGEEKLAVDLVPIEEMRRAKQWGEAFLRWLLEFVDRAPNAAKSDR